MNCEKIDSWCISKDWCVTSNVCKTNNICKDLPNNFLIKNTHHYIFYIARFGNK